MPGAPVIRRGAVLLASFLLTLSACSGNGGPDGPLRPTWNSIHATVIRPHCAQANCHAGGNVESQLDLSSRDAYTALVNRPSHVVSDWILVIPGNPAESYLMRKLNGDRIVGERMPQGQPPLPDSVLTVIRKWIAAGAPRK